MRILNIFLVVLFLTSCSNDMTLLHSKMEQSNVQGVFSSKSGSFPIAKNYTNFFTYADVKGEIHFNNQLKFDEKKETFFSEDQYELFKVNVALYQLKNENASYFLSHISGAISLPNGQVVSPIRTYIVNSSSLCESGHYSVSDPSESYLVHGAPDRTCLIFEYEEIVNPGIKFTFKLGRLKVGNEHHELEFNFVPMVMKHTSH